MNHVLVFIEFVIILFLLLCSGFLAKRHVGSHILALEGELLTNGPPGKPPGYQFRCYQNPHRNTQNTVGPCIWVGFPGGSDGKESTNNEGDLGSIPGLGRSPGGGHGHPIQYSCLENLPGQRSLEGYSPWARKEVDMTEWLSLSLRNEKKT